MLASMSDGWPEDWVARLAGKDCPMCAAIGLGDNEHGVYLWTGRASEVWLQRHASVKGYCVVWRDGHVVEPTELEPAAAVAYWEDVLDVGRALQDTFHPIKVNYMMLGNNVPHLHAHVFPRYADDPAPGGPLSWEALTGVTATAREVLEEQAASLRAAAGRS
jgi:diadenosine tetraphosphate (Ap4A) HIT family hydrolase